MEDKAKLTALLTAFKSGIVDFNYAIDFILHIYRDSRRFNWYNFSLGMSVGAILMYILMKYIV